MKEQDFKINNQIAVKRVRLVGEGVESKVCHISEALTIADNLGLDLVLINEASDPPVCKVMDYAKYKFDKKKLKQNKGKPLKEMRYTPNIDTNDLEFKLKHVRSFIDKGHKVKVFVLFKGREMNFKEKGQTILLDLITKVEDIAAPESLPIFEGNKYIVTLKPKRISNETL
jgi:translation initiation factor IF-3